MVKEVHNLLGAGQESVNEVYNLLGAGQEVVKIVCLHKEAEFIHGFLVKIGSAVLVVLKHAHHDTGFRGGVAGTVGADVGQRHAALPVESADLGLQIQYLHKQQRMYILLTP